MKPTLLEEIGAARFHHLRGQLKGTLISSTKHAVSANDIDWQLLKHDINVLLGEFGYSLEDVVREKPDWYRE